MSHFFPHSEYAEDQPLDHAILTTHVLSRGFQVGSALGLLIGPAYALIKRQPITTSVLIRSAGVGAPIGTGIAGAMLAYRMWGREEIEWKDRSWALMKNEGQVAVDDWSQPGAVLGATIAAMRKPVGDVSAMGWKRVAGGAGVGSLVGLVGCVVWRKLRKDLS